MTTDTEPPPVSTPDGTAYPYVQDLDRVWHIRPPDDEWTRGAEFQARTLCDKGASSVHASEFDPREADWYDADEEPVCQGCDDAKRQAASA